MTEKKGKASRSSTGTKHTPAKRPMRNASKSPAKKSKTHGDLSPSLASWSELSQTVVALDDKLPLYPTTGNTQSVKNFLTNLADALIEALLADISSSHSKSVASNVNTPADGKSIQIQDGSNSGTDSSELRPLIKYEIKPVRFPAGKRMPSSSAPAILTTSQYSHIEEVVIDSGRVDDSLLSEAPPPRRRIKHLPKRRQWIVDNPTLAGSSTNGGVASPSANVPKKKAPRLEKHDSASKASPGKRADSVTSDVPASVNKSAVVSSSSRLPWWRSSQNRVTVPDSPPNIDEIFRGYIRAIVKASINSSWTCSDLITAFDGDPCGEKGRGFMDVSSALVLMERARHMGHCRARWHPDVVCGLLNHSQARWSRIPLNKDDDFVGCDVCGRVRPATEKLLLSGQYRDGREFWPTQMRIDVLSMKNVNDEGCYSLTVEVNRECIGTDSRGLTNSNDEVSLFVDSQCLRQCLVFHRLAHATSLIANEVRGMIEDELREGIMELNASPGADDRAVLDALDDTLLKCVIEHSNYLKPQVEILLNMLKLGDLYLSAEEEVIDSGSAKDLPRSTNSKPSIYDPPLYLADERFNDQIKRLVAMSQIVGG